MIDNNNNSIVASGVEERVLTDRANLMWTAPNKEGVGHAASCRFGDLGWWERRCRCDSIECELDAASSVPFKIKSSIALAYY